MPMLRRIWSKYDASILLGVIALALALVIGGAVLVYGSVQKEEPVGCTTEIVELTAPMNSALVLDTIEMLVEGDVLPSVEDGLDAFVKARYIFDESELEYWLYFESGERIVAAEFNFTCPLDLEDVPLDLEYEGTRVVE